MILVGADIIRPVILEQNHIGIADISPVSQAKSEISVKFWRADIIRPYEVNRNVYSSATGPSFVSFCQHANQIPLTPQKRIESTVNV